MANAPTLYKNWQERFADLGTINLTGVSHVMGYTSTDGNIRFIPQAEFNVTDTGAQIVNKIDTQLGNNTWQSGGSADTGAQIVVKLDTQLGSAAWQGGADSGNTIVTKLNTELGNTDWQTGGTGSTDTGAEIVVKLDTELGSNAWQGGPDTSAGIVAKIDAILGSDWQLAPQDANAIITKINTQLGNTNWQSGGGGAVTQIDLGGLNGASNLAAITGDTKYRCALDQDATVTIPTIAADIPIDLQFSVLNHNGGNHSFSVNFPFTDTVIMPNNAPPVVAQADNTRTLVVATSTKFAGGSREWYFYAAVDNA